MSRVALITGGGMTFIPGTTTCNMRILTDSGSGMGLEVARLLAATGNWSLHLVDVNSDAGQKAAASFSKGVATFHHADITKYEQLGQAFHRAFQAQGRLDFVYANAGIKESGDIYAEYTDDGVPPEPNQLVVDINLKAVINSCYLASHFFRRSPGKGHDADIVITASAGSLYPLDSAPMYAGGKFGALGFMWSIARTFMKRWGIRVNAVLPGPVPTNLIPTETWQIFDQSLMTPVTAVAKVVVQFVDHGQMKDGNGVVRESKDTYGIAAEVITDQFFFRAPPSFCNEAMEKVMAGNDL